jgi:peptidyl-prolyl cis-trans isomerase B (cyclophilin B)
MTRYAFFRLTAVAAAFGSAALLGASSAHAQAPAEPPAGKAGVVHPIATIVTDKGTIKIKLYPEDAPITVANFIKLANKKFYDGLTFHRVVPGFVIQGGDPKGDGSGGPGYEIKNENNHFLKHNRGAVAMANAGRDTAGSQFYIVIDQPAPNLDEKDPDGVNKYTLFGMVISGQEVAEKIEVGDHMKKVTISMPKPAAPVAPTKK